MRWLWALGFLSLTLADVVQHELIRIKSGREQMIEDGTYEAYRRHRRAAMIRNFFLNKGQPLGDHYGQNQKDIGDVVYVSRIGIGTPTQWFHMIMDTGSSNCWVPGVTCGKECSILCDIPVFGYKCDNPKCAGCAKCETLARKESSASAMLGLTAPAEAANPCSGKSLYDPKKSSTFQKVGLPFAIQYGTGSCSGTVGSDIVQLGGPNNTGALGTRAKIGIANHLAAFFANQPLDGICGLAWPSISVDHLEPLFFDMLPKLDLPLFTVWFNSTHQNKGSLAGLITYGAYDTTHCSVDSSGNGINWVSLSSTTYWEFRMDAMAVGSTSVSSGGAAISDTGTSLLAGPTEQVAKIGKAVGGTFDSSIQGYTLPCSMASATGPTIDVTIGGKLYSILPRDYVIQSGQPGQCMLAAQGFELGFGGPQWILGDTFIRSHCNFYNVKTKSIGFSKIRDHHYPPNSN